MSLLHWLNKLARWLGWQTILNFGLLLMAVTATAWSLAASARGLDTGLAVTTVTVALWLGWALGAARPLPAWLSLVLLTVFGLEAIAVRIGRLGAALVDLAQSLANTVWQAARIPQYGLPTSGPLSESLTQFWVQLNTLLGRVLAWALSLTSGEPAFDPVAAALVWSLALWLAAGWAGWAVRRWGRPLLGLTPAGLLLATTLAYRPQDALQLTPLLTAVLLLMGFTKHQARERSWQARRIDYSSDLLVDLTTAVIPIAVLLVVLAIVTPSVSVRQIRERFAAQADLAEPLARSLGVDLPRHSQPIALQTVRAPGLPRRHLLGSGPELSRQVALLIQVQSPQTGNDPERAVAFSAQPLRQYWRSLTYDRYSGRGWSTRSTRLLRYDPGEQTLANVPPHRQLQRQTVQTVSDQSNRLYAAGDIVTADHKFEIEWRGPADAFGAIVETGTYQADSLITTATADDLRTANNTYPDWLSRRYLSLPPDTPERVLSLARDLTATAPTPYDRAKAIEAYLRQFPYSLDLPEPPSKRDMVDYFLFELQRGYCDYYATTMVVLARAAGLPARLAVGYVGGRYNPVSQQYTITEAEAHSWPEIYFPNYGWIGFEPTAAQPVDRPGSNSEVGPAVPPAPFPITELETMPRQLPPWVAWIIAIVGLAGLGVVGWLMTETWRLRQLSPTEAITALYSRLVRHGAWLATPVNQAYTPLEFTSALSRHVRQIATGRRWSDQLQPLAQEANWLTCLYMQTVYSSHPPSATDQTQAIQVWQRLRRRLWLVRLSALWSKLKQKICR